MSNQKQEVSKEQVLELVELMGYELAYQKLTQVAVSSDKKSTKAEEIYLQMYKDNSNLERKDFIKKVVDEMELMGHNYGTTFWQQMRKKHKHNVK